MAIKLIIFLFLIPSTIYADEWTRFDTGMQLIYSGLHIADWNQTLQIVKSDKHKEANKILGEYPSKDQINLYFSATFLAHYYIARKLKKPYRTYWQTIWIYREYDAVNHNRKIGLNINFNF